MELLFKQAERFGQTLVMVTHDMSILGGMDRTIDFEQFRHESAEGAKTTEASS